ncbi:MAG: hypothetical protein JJ992_22890, partial [Planctomycetes bacterium]|nr:hypothetical protein [Planctomycetota bacterium]
MRCVDCHTPVPVRPPQPRHSPPAPKTREAGDDDEYQLSAPVQRPGIVEVHERILMDAEREIEKERKSAESEPAARRSLKDVIAENAREVLHRAESEAAEVDREAGRYVIRPLFAGL